MGIIAWAFLGLASGLLAYRLIPSMRTQRLVLVCALSITGALIGGQAAVTVFHAQASNGFFDLSSWLAALIGAVIALVTYHTLTGRSSETGRPGERLPAVRPGRRPGTSR